MRHQNAFMPFFQCVKRKCFIIWIDAPKLSIHIIISHFLFAPLFLYRNRREQKNTCKSFGLIKPTHTQILVRKKCDAHYLSITEQQKKEQKLSNQYLSILYVYISRNKRRIMSICDWVSLFLSLFLRDIFKNLYVTCKIPIHCTSNNEIRAQNYSIREQKAVFKPTEIVACKCVNVCVCVLYLMRMEMCTSLQSLGIFLSIDWNL